MRLPASFISRTLRIVVCLNVCWAGARLQSAEDPPPEPSAAEREFFEKEVRPLLVMQCYKCHSAGEKKRGGLLLDSREGALEGGDNGPALEPGKPDESRLVQAIRYT